MMSTSDLDEENGVEETVSPDSDLRAELSAAWDEHAAAPAADPEVEAVPQEDEPVAPKQTATERSRDERGRFAEKAQPSGVEQTIEGESASIRETPNFQPPVLPPASWAADKKADWANVPRGLQEEIQRVDLDTRRQLQRVSEDAAQVKRTWADVEQALGPRLQDFARAGVTPGCVVQQFMAWQDKLDSDPRQGLRELAASYGLDIRQLADEEAQQPQEPHYVREMRQQIQGMQGLLQQRQQAEASVQQQQLSGQIAAFANEQDAQGNLRRPYLENVIDDMLPIVQQMRAQSPYSSAGDILQQAYEKALWLNPDTRAIELSRHRVTAQSPKKLEQAKRAQKLVNGAARSGFVAHPPDNLRGVLEAAWDEHEGKI